MIYVDFQNTMSKYLNYIFIYPLKDLVDVYFWLGTIVYNVLFLKSCDCKKWSTNVFDIGTYGTSSNSFSSI